MKQNQNLHNCFVLGEETTGMLVLLQSSVFEIQWDPLVQEFNLDLMGTQFTNLSHCWLIQLESVPQ